MAVPSVTDLAYPLRLEPGAGDDDALAELARVIGDARVVCLGESAHWVSEFARIRDRVTRFLVRELGFTALVLESGLPEGLLVDRWVRGGPGRLGDIARDGIDYGFGRCAEMHTQLRWMREWNRTHPRRQVGFYGMDVPGWCADPGPGVAACLDRIPARAGDRELRASVDLGTPSSGPAPDASDAPAVPSELAGQLDERVDRAEAAGDRLAQQCARGARAVAEFLSHGLYPAPGRNLRNEVMAENLTGFLERESRVVVAAHTMHLQRAPSWDGTDTIGSLLAPVLGGDMVVIGGTHTSGRIPDLQVSAPPEGRYPVRGDEPAYPAQHTLEAALDTAGHPVSLVGLRAPGASRALAGATAIRAQTPSRTMLVGIEPGEAFDAVIHVRRISPVHAVDDG